VVLVSQELSKRSDRSRDLPMSKQETEWNSTLWPDSIFPEWLLYFGNWVWGDRYGPKLGYCVD
jgi:hypothetical protein